MTATDSTPKLSESAWVAPQRRARVAVRGPDARAFLHRMSTQHVEALGPGESRLSVLTSQKGRVVDVVHHLTLADDEVVLLGAHEAGAALVEWLDGFLFVEDAELEDLSAAGGVVVVAGAQAPEVVAALLPGADALEPWAMAREGALLVVRSFPVGDGAPAYLLWDADSSEAELSRRCEDAGATKVSAAALDDARIEAGTPAAPGEVSDRYNPLELALHDAIHWAKGCYIGQEVIARIDNYGKQARQLVVVEAGDGAGLRVGDELRADDRVVGELTSVASDGRRGLAVIKHKGDVDGATLEAGDAVVSAHRGIAAQQPHD
jgi:folate-binding protein YgfZ